jgi:hypothetical protein
MKINDITEGYKVLPPIDREKYQPRDGLEGPFRLRNSKVVYYDPQEGSYYDPDTDMYISYDDYKQMDEQGVAEAAPKKKAPLAKELNFHGYTIRVSNKPNAEKQFTGIAFLPGKGGSVRQERFVGASGEEVESKAKNWVLSFNERRTWDNIKDSRVTVDFNSEFIKNYRQGNDNFWSKFTMLDNNTPAFLIAPDSAEDEFGVEILRGEGYSKASPKKIATTGEIGNTSVTNIAKVRAVKAGLIPNGRYTLEKSNKKTKSLGSDIFTLAYHSTVDAPNAPMRLSDPGVTIAANREVGEASDKRPKYVVTTKDKPKKVKPSMGGESPHPYQGKLVGATEAEVSNTDYEWTHGKKPKGTGSWFFVAHRGGIDFGKDVEGEDYIQLNQMSYADAKKAAVKWAKSKGHTRLFVAT